MENFWPSSGGPADRLMKASDLNLNSSYPLRKRIGTALVLMAAMLVLALLVPQAKAQTKDFTKWLTLEDRQEQYKLDSLLYLTRSPEKSLNFENYQAFIERHKIGVHGDLVKGNILNLGAGNAPDWIVFAVNNQSWTEEWVLFFGGHMDGRIGFLEDIFVYDHDAKKTYINTLQSSQNPYVKSGILRENALTLHLPRGKKTLIFMHVTPKPGIPATLALELMTKDAYVHKTTGWLNQSHLVGLFFVLITGFFIATICLRQMWGSLLVIFYYGVTLALFLYHNDTVQSDFFLASRVPGLLLAANVILGLALTKFFLGIGKLQRLQGRIIGILALLLILSSSLSAFLLPPGSIYQIAAMYAPPLLAYLFLFMLSLVQGYNDRQAGYHLAAGWLFVLAGACATAIGLSNIFMPSALMINGFWYGLVLQGFTFLSATTSRLIAEDRSYRLEMREKKEEQNAISGIVASKESTENARLMRMIEHERLVMNELREREIQQSEEMKRAKEAADMANNAKSAFLAIISHEIRTPMTGIMGMVRFLLETKLAPNQREYAQTIQDSGDAMISLLNDILDFEKIEGGKMDMEHIDFDLHRLLTGIKTLMSGHAETKNIFLKIDMDQDTPRYVIGDPIRLRQVILNLTGNSIKFTSRGGVTIHVKSDPFTAGAAGGKGMRRIRFAIEDTGVGISKEGQKNLFNPFTQADSSVSRQYGGTGLGLAISQKLIEAMGGHIEIDSTEGSGSTFFFTLVMEEGSASAVEDQNVAKETQTGGKPDKVLKILIVEDNAINQKLMKELVDRMGHETCIAGTGEDAIEIVKSRDLDMILMDIELPGITGMGATKAIRALPAREKASLPVIALSGNVRNEDVRQCYAANMNGHLAKPIDPKKLKDQIRKVLDGKLDNPVQVREDKEDEHTQITQLSVGTETFGRGPHSQTAAHVNEKRSDPAAQGLFQDGPKEPDGMKQDIPLITALARQERSLPDISEEELDDDSFEEALSEAKNGKNGHAAGGGMVYDPVMLDGLQTTMGKENFSSLIKDMMIKTDQLIEDIRRASVQRNIPELTARAHELKGMAGNFGLTEICALAARTETAARTNDQAGIVETLPSLSAARDKAQIVLKEWAQF